MTQRERELLNLTYWDTLVAADAWMLTTLVPLPHVALLAESSATAALVIAEMCALVAIDNWQTRVQRRRWAC